MLPEKLTSIFARMSSDEYDTLGGKRNRSIHRKIIYVALLVLLILALLAFVTAFVIIPIVFMLSFSFQDALMFTRFGLPSDVESFDLHHIAGLKNFYVNFTDVETNNTITLGAWHLLPWSLVSESVTNPNFNYDEALLNSSFPVLIHFHGTGETRRDSYALFVVLRIFFHVIAFDYRSYGDSSRGRMTEDAVVEDCVQFVKWVHSRTESKVFIWGHSLGASLATRSVAHLKGSDVNISGLILEAPFTSMREEIPHHPFGKIFAWLPWFDATMLDPLDKNGFRFDNTKNIVNVDSPIMVLNAIDDGIVPYTLGTKLVDEARSIRIQGQGNVTYYTVPAVYGCDHYWIYLDPDLPYKIWLFLTSLNSTDTTPRDVTVPSWLDFL